MPQDILPYPDKAQDRRVKIPPERYEEVKEYYRENGQSQRKTARHFEVDKGTIKAILDPQWYQEKQRKRYQQQPWKEYYNKDTHTKAMRSIRANKRKLNLLSRVFPEPIPDGYMTQLQAQHIFKSDHRTMRHAIQSQKIKTKLFPKSHATQLLSIASLLEWNNTRGQHKIINPIL